MGKRAKTYKAEFFVASNGTNMFQVSTDYGAAFIKAKRKHKDGQKYKLLVKKNKIFKVKRLRPVRLSKKDIQEALKWAETHLKDI